MKHDAAGYVALAIADVANAEVAQGPDIGVGIVSLVDMGIDSK